MRGFQLRPGLMRGQRLRLWWFQPQMVAGGQDWAQVKVVAGPFLPAIQSASETCGPRGLISLSSCWGQSGVQQVQLVEMLE